VQPPRSALTLSLVAAPLVVVATATGFLIGHAASGRPSAATCKPAAAADVAVVAQLLRSTVPTTDGVRLEHAQTTALATGLYYLGARVVDRTGRPLGTGVWRVISTRNTFGFPADVAAANPVAETLTPDLSTVAYAGSAGPPECLVAH